jgi:hypothetical protein
MFNVRVQHSKDACHDNIITDAGTYLLLFTVYILVDMSFIILSLQMMA